MKKIFICLFCVLSLFSCLNDSLNNNSNKDSDKDIVDEFTFKQQMKETNNNFNYQYDIRLGSNDVDIRTFMCHGHEYIIGVSHVGRGGGMDIEHSASCPNEIHKNR